MFHTQSFERSILHSGWQIQLQAPLLYIPPTLALAKSMRQGDDGVAAWQKWALFPPPILFSLPPSLLLGSSSCCSCCQLLCMNLFTGLF